MDNHADFHWDKKVVFRKEIFKNLKSRWGHLPPVEVGAPDGLVHLFKTGRLQYSSYFLYMLYRRGNRWWDFWNLLEFLVEILESLE